MKRLTLFSTVLDCRYFASVIYVCWYLLLFQFKLYSRERERERERAYHQTALLFLCDKASHGGENCQPHQARFLAGSKSSGGHLPTEMNSLENHHA